MKYLARTMRLAVIPCLLAAADGHAAAIADADISITTFRVLDASGASVALDPGSWTKAYSSATASELVNGQDYRSFEAGSHRQAITSLCAGEPAVAGLDMAGSACTGSIPGTTHSEADSTVFNSSSAAHGLQYFSFSLPSGFSFEINGIAHAHALSTGVPDASATLPHVSTADAGIVIGPQLFELRGFSASVSVASNALHSFAEASQSTPFSYSTTNVFPYAISVLLAWSSNASVGNAAAAVPEASTMAMLLLGLPLIGLVCRRRSVAARSSASPC